MWREHTDLSTSTLVARQLTENADDMVDEEKEMSSDDLTITGDYSDSDILEEEKDTISEKDYVWVKKKRIGRVLLIPYRKKRGWWIFEDKMDRLTERGKNSYEECITELLQQKSFGDHKTVL